MRFLQPIFTAVFVGIFCFMQSSKAQLPGLNLDFWNSTLPSLVVAEDSVNNAVYYGGRGFNNDVFPNKPFSIIFDAENAAPTLTSKVPNAAVHASVSDGNGGWFIGGDFTEVGGESRMHIAQLDSDGNLTGWNPGASGRVSVLKVFEDRLYVGGDFDVLAGKSRLKTGSFDLADGKLNGWVVNVFGQHVNDLAVGSEKAYIGGLFNRVNLTGLNGGAVDAATGEGAGYFAFPDGKVNCSASDGNGGFFIGGLFSKVAGIPRQNIAHLDADGNVSSWNPGADGEVNALILKDNFVLIGGDFSRVAGVPRKGAAAVHSSTGEANSWNPKFDGEVSTFDTVGDKIYVGGDYYAVGDWMSNGAPLDAESGDVLFSEDFPDGEVMAAVSDGQGGWFIGGEFFNVGNTERVRIAHIDASGDLTEWYPGPVGGTVEVLELIGDRLFVAGTFSSVGTFDRSGLAAVDAQSGEVLPWSTFASNRINDMLAHEGVLYIGGAFIEFGGVSRSRLAAIDPISEELLPFSPGVSGDISALQAKGDTLFFGGSFLGVNTMPRSRLACVSTVSGELLDWNPSPNNTVLSLAILNNTIYVGGTFANVDGLWRTRMAAFDIPTGELTPWQPSNLSTSTQKLAASGNKIYASGNFTRADGTLQRRVAAFDPVSGDILDWDPNIPTGLNLDALAVNGNAVYIGGSIPAIGGDLRRGASAFDGVTGNLLSWDPMVSGAVRVMHAQGQNLFLGGIFSNVGGVSRSRLAAVDLNTAEVSPWSVNMNILGQINAITGTGNTIFLGGTFNSINGESRFGLAAVDTSIGTVSSFDANVSDPNVLTLQLHEDVLYVGGIFSGIGGVSRPRAAAVNAGSGELLPWNLGTFAGHPLSLEYAEGKVYVGGNFGTTWGGVSIQNLAAVDATDGAADALNVQPSGEVMSLLLADSTLYFGGDFQQVAGVSRSRFAAINTLNEDVLPLNPNFNAPVKTIASHSDNLWVGGRFTSVNGIPRRHLAVIGKTSGQLSLSTPAIVGNIGSSEVNSIAIDAGVAYITGNFTTIDGVSNRGVTSFDVLTGNVNGWNANLQGTGRTIAVSDSKVFTGGDFVRAGFRSAEGLIALSTSTGAPNGFEMSVEGIIRTLKVHNNMLYMGGNFSQIDGQPRTNLAAVDLSTGELSDWAPEGFQGITQLEAFGNRIFAAGFNISNNPSYSFDVFHSETGAPDSFNPAPDGAVASMVVAEGRLYIGGSFNEVAGETRPHFAVFDAENTALLPFNPAPNGRIRSMSFANQTLCLAGEFTQFGGQNRTNLAALNTETELVLGWNPSVVPAFGVFHLAAWKGQLILSGSFVQIEGLPRFGLASASLADGSFSEWDPNPEFAPNIGINSLNLAASPERLYVIGRFEKLEGQVAGSPAVFGPLSASCPITPLCQSFTLTLENGDSSVLNPGDIDAGSTAACGVASISVSPDVFGPDDIGENSVTLTVTDTQGNSATCEATVTVVDGGDLTLQCPDDVEQSCAESALPEVTGTATAQSPCGIESLVYTDSTAQDNCSLTILRTWTAADLCGNTLSCEQVITQLFDEAPELIMPVQTSTGLTCSILSPDELNSFLDGQMNGPDADTYAAYLEQLFETYGMVPPGAMSECSEAEVVLTGFSPGADVSCPVKAVVQAEWKAVDACGNESEVMTTAFTVSDFSTPVIFGAPDVVIACDDPVTPDFTGFSTASDNCDDEVLLTYSDALLGSGCGTSFIRLWTASDQCGNTATYEQFITLAEQPASCTSPPTGLSASPLGEGVVELSWNPVPGTVACRVFGRLAGGSGSVAAGTVTGNEPSTVTVTNSSLKDGRQIEWRVICACSTQPLVTTPYSAWSNFTFYAPQGSASIAVPTGDAAAAALNVWPNPTDGIATVTFNASVSGDAGLELFDIHGRSVEKLFDAYVESGAEHTLRLDGNGLASGVYLCRLTTAAGVEMRRLIVAR